MRKREGKRERETKRKHEKEKEAEEEEEKKREGMKNETEMDKDREEGGRNKWHTRLTVAYLLLPSRRPCHSNQGCPEGQAGLAGQ